MPFSEGDNEGVEGGAFDHEGAWPGVGDVGGSVGFESGGVYA